MPPKQSSSAKKRGPTKAELYRSIADATGLSRAQVANVFVELQKQIGGAFKQGQDITLPGLVKLTLKRKEAVPAGERRNPFTGEMKWQPAKPPANKVKANPVKALKDLAPRP
jgi:nucleoid DNA-binding protein